MGDVKIVYELVYVNKSLVGVTIIGAADTINGMNKLVREYEEKWGEDENLRVQTVDGLNINSGCYATFVWGFMWGVGFVACYFTLFVPGGAG